MNYPNSFRLRVVEELRQSSCELCIHVTICWQICCHLLFFRSCQLEKLLTSSNLKFGSSGRIRTYDQSVNPDFVGTLPLSYHSISVNVLESGAQTSIS